MISLNIATSVLSGEIPLLSEPPQISSYRKWLSKPGSDLIQRHVQPLSTDEARMSLLSTVDAIKEHRLYSKYQRLTHDGFAQSDSNPLVYFYLGMRASGKTELLVAMESYLRSLRESCTIVTPRNVDRHSLELRGVFSPVLTFSQICQRHFRGLSGWLLVDELDPPMWEILLDTQMHRIKADVLKLLCTYTYDASSSESEELFVPTHLPVSVVGRGVQVADVLCHQFQNS